MASNRTPYILYDIADFVNGRPCTPSEFGASGLPIIKIAELNSGIGAGTKYLSSTPLDKHCIHDGDLLFAWSASVGVYHWSGGPAVLNQHIFKVQAREVVDQGYLRYLLMSLLPIFKGIVADQATTMGHVKVADLKGMTVHLPPLAEQAAIASVLGALDDRIENLRATNETLEAIVQALFKSWFVDFDPVKAKAAGKAPVGMDAETAALFPSEFEESELGLIPKGWSVGRLADILDIQGGTQPPASEFVETEKDGYVRLLQIRDFSNENHKTYIPLRKSLRIVSEDDVLIGRYGSGSGDSKTDSLGRLLRGLSGAINVAVVKAIPKKHAYQEWIASYVGSGLFYSAVVGGSARAVQAGFKKDDLALIKVPVAQDAIYSAFSSISHAVWATRKQLTAELAVVSQLRDTLLPKLISGEIRLPGFGDD